MLRNQPKWIQRLLIVVLVAVVALIARTIAVELFGIDFVSNGGELGHDDLDVGVRPALIVPGIAGLLGWAALEVLERVAAQRAKVIWIIGALLFYVATLAPVLPWDMAGETKIALVIFHTLVAAIYIPLMARTSAVKTPV